MVNFYLHNLGLDLDVNFRHTHAPVHCLHAPIARAPTPHVIVRAKESGCVAFPGYTRDTFGNTEPQEFVRRVWRLWRCRQKKSSEEFEIDDLVLGGGSVALAASRFCPTTSSGASPPASSDASFPPTSSGVSTTFPPSN